ncbi:MULTISPECIES: type II toxin-antitoxin system HicA family toxin [unclassified Rhizobium]|uniref:type II toxin-antitoxin system HicA family toxin n=1 Tax=unclassified Rhizobium TaxID=2613769 RepID=UPI0021F7FE95|nr:MULTISPECIES: type II toxin-antitoxin system HicA family toxin [unclassified Rhizobium]MCV9944023.1 type II toxin-antitoxin system HicA family toxin [Rhizobium sp. BT-175]MCW0017588.1 type II toxin-antitoxin system HicA family toxin [Rhizobium sp. BT-226]
MAGYLRELKELLLKAGCEYVRPGKGDHEIWYSPISNRHFTDQGVKSRHTANETLKQAGLPKAF